MTSSAAWLWVFSLASGALLTLVAVRFGLLTLVVTWFVWSALYGVPMTVDVMPLVRHGHQWTLALLAALAWFGFWTARAGLPLLGVRRPG